VFSSCTGGGVGHSIDGPIQLVRRDNFGGTVVQMEQGANRTDVFEEKAGSSAQSGGFGELMLYVSCDSNVALRD
jgi:hypothetical protein